MEKLRWHWGRLTCLLMGHHWDWPGARPGRAFIGYVCTRCGRFKPFPLVG